MTRDEPAERRLIEVAARLIHNLDRLAVRPGPLADAAVFVEAVERRLAEAAAADGQPVAAYRAAFVRIANDHGWDLAEDGSNWADRWTAIQAAARRQARWDEIRDNLEDLD